jgi:hypothetical protein
LSWQPLRRECGTRLCVPDAPVLNDLRLENVSNPKSYVVYPAIFSTSSDITTIPTDVAVRLALKYAKYLQVRHSGPRPAYYLTLSHPTFGEPIRIRAILSKNRDHVTVGRDALQFLLFAWDGTRSKWFVGHNSLLRRIIFKCLR